MEAVAAQAPLKAAAQTDASGSTARERRTLAAACGPPWAEASRSSVLGRSAGGRWFGAEWAALA